MQKILHGNRKGFTLTELIIVVTILGILAVLVTPLVSGMVDDAKIKSDSSNAKLLENAIARSLARGQLQAAQSNSLLVSDLQTKASVVAAIAVEIPSIPTPKQTDFEYYVCHTQTGSYQPGVVVAAATEPVASKFTNLN